MILHNLVIAIIGLLSFSGLHAQQHACKPVALQCEHLYNPLGIDAAAPRLAWKLEDDRYGAVQRAYRIVIGKDSLAVSAGEGNVWDSERVADASQLVRYAGTPLESFTRYYWKVQVWDKDFQVSESDVAAFETAMMNGTDWVGDWIFDKQDVEYRPTPLFRKSFDTNGAKTIASARVYIAAGGLYEFYLNGQRIGDRLLDPVFTRYDRRTMYATLDVTEQLKAGSNAIGVMLGNGWYNHQSKAVWYFDNAPWRGRQRFCLDLRITYADGTEEVIATGPDWKMANSPYLFNSIYTGERYDARLEQPGWNDVGFDDGAWEDARIATAPATVIAAQQMHPIRVIDELAPISVKKINDTTHLFTFPRNIAGVSKLNIKAPRGTVFTLTHGEVLNEGRLNTYRIGNKRRESDIPDSMATDIYIAKGDGQETFHSVFNYKGFQYVEVTTSTPIDLGSSNLSALVVHSDVPPMGSVKTSNELVNGIFSATNNSYLNNLHGYPTDCPHREKNGWTADGHIAIETALFGFDGITIYEKWLQDHLDEQQPNGTLPNKIPNAGQDYEWANGADWTSSMIIIPWQIYQFYGDTKLLETTYEGMKRYMTLLERRSDGGILSWALGDWSPVKTRSDTVFISSLYYYLDASILSKTASVLGKAADEHYYGKLAEQIKLAINTRFLDDSSGNYAGGSQTELSAALYFGIVPDELKPKVVTNLVNKVHEANDHLDVGLLGAKTLFNALSENGYGDLALKVLSQSTFPSFGYWIANGATTLYETWPIEFDRIASLNHIMFGECAAWLYKSVGGIHPDPEQPGFKNIVLKPLFADSLDEAEAFHVSPFGKIVSAWKRSGEKIRYEVCIPPNSTALLHLPIVFKTVTLQGQDITKHPYIVAADEIDFANTYQLAAGSYVFEIQKQ